jgi:hypothetical protein
MWYPPDPMSAEINNYPVLQWPLEAEFKNNNPSTNLQEMLNYFLLLCPTDVVKKWSKLYNENFVFYSSISVVQIEGTLDLTYTSDVETRYVCKILVGSCHFI